MLLHYIIKSLGLLHITGGIFLLIGKYFKIQYVERKHLWEALGSISFMNIALIMYHNQHNHVEHVLDLLEHQVAWLIYGHTYQYISHDPAYTNSIQVLYHAYIVMFWVIHQFRLVNNGIFLTIIFNWLSIIKNVKMLKFS